MALCEILFEMALYEIFKNIYLEEHLQMTASKLSLKRDSNTVWVDCQIWRIFEM